MNILVLNCGSSSLKFQLIDINAKRVLAKGICERIGIEGGKLVYTPDGGEKTTKLEDMPDHTVAVKLVIDSLTDKEIGVIEGLSCIDAVGHRVVHGGEKFADSTIIDDEVIEAIRECNELAPLHNPANLIGIEACKRLMPKTPMVAVFDTAFHQTMPEKAFIYGIPYEYYLNYKIRRYGFHGTSHSYVSKRAAEVLGRDNNNLKTIVCHLGNGASVAAVLNGKSVDTSMGMTPLEGLLMGTRSGDMDPAIIEFINHKEGKSIDEIMNILNKKSGVLGVSNGLSSDFRDLDDGEERGDPHAIRALEVFAYRVAKYIGAYVAAMNGVDVICFTAGLGENSRETRGRICDYLGYLGVKINDEANSTRGKEIIISENEVGPTVIIIPTDEELTIAISTAALL